MFTNINTIRKRRFQWNREHVENALLGNNHLAFYNAVGWFFFAAGLFSRIGEDVGIPDTTIYLHELYHAIAVVLTGGRVVDLVTDHVTWNGGSTNIIVGAGFWGELLVSFIIAYKAPSRHVGKFFGGIYVASIFYALQPTGDFSRLPPANTTVWIISWFVGVTILAYVLSTRGTVRYPPVPKSVALDYPDLVKKAKL